MDEDRTDELVKDIDRFSSLVCLLRDCYDVSPLYGNWSLPAASTERSDNEQRTGAGWTSFLLLCILFYRLHRFMIAPPAYIKNSINQVNGAVY